jgi:hypothetical protein
MKKILLFITGCIGLLSPVFVKAQSFTTNTDTVWANVGGIATVHNDITNTTSNNLTVNWRVVATNWPADWLDNVAFGICDNRVCRNNINDSLLWHAATSTGTSFASDPYTPGIPGTYELSLDFSTVSLGSHWIKVAITDPLTSYTKTITFVINKIPTSTPAISNGNNDVLMYPNPAHNELNVVYDANADIKNIAVYNIIGKVITVYKVSGSSANLNLENVPSGVYFVRLINSKGSVVTTRKFTKQ